MKPEYVELKPGARIKTVIKSQMRDRGLAGNMHNLTNETLKHLSTLVEDFSMKLTNSGRLICCCYINIENCCLHEGKELAQVLIVRQVEHVVGFKQFVKCTQRASGLAGDELFVHNNVENVSLVPGSTNSKDVWLSPISSPKVFIQAAA